jgi:hypothetical protein
VAAVVGGFNSKQQTSNLVATVVTAIREQQPAFPQDLDENKLDLRVCCALAVGNLLDASRASENDPLIQEAAALGIAGLAYRRPVGDRYLDLMLSDLASLAISAQNRAAEARRNREQAVSYINAIDEAAADIPTLAKDVKKHLRNAVEALDRNATLDREELDVLWWTYNGYCEVLNQPYLRLSASLCALCCGAELAGMIAYPPPPRIRHLLSRVLHYGRDKRDLSPSPLGDHLKTLTSNAVALLRPFKPEVAEVVRANPVLFPLSWSCLRYAESDGEFGWLGELRTLTGWDPAEKYEPIEIAGQIFNERTAQSI